MLRIDDHKSNWIKSLLNERIKPEIFLLDTIDDSEWIFWEQWYIAYFRGMGCELTNDIRCPGGENPPNHKGSHQTQEHITKRTKSLIGKPSGKKGIILSDESKKKISIGNSGKIRTQEMKDHLSMMKIGKSNGNHTDASKKKMSLAKIKIKDNDIEQILILSDQGKSSRKLAKMFNVSHRSILRIRKNEQRKFDHNIGVSQ